MQRQIWSDHHPLLNDWVPLVASNPIIEQRHAFGLMRGLHAGLTGDWLIAAHLITPRIESTLRHILELNGIDTSAINSDMTQTVKLLVQPLNWPNEWYF